MCSYYLAVDIGASSGRHVIGWVQDGTMKIREIYRFSNGMRDMGGTLCWDTDRVLLALDFFDAGINRIAAWVMGMRNMQKALLCALLMPGEKLAGLQEERRFTELMMLQEELKTYPFGDVWDYFCAVNQVPVREQWFEHVQAYERDVLSLRG